MRNIFYMYICYIGSDIPLGAGLQQLVGIGMYFCGYRSGKKNNKTQE